MLSIFRTITPIIIFLGVLSSHSLTARYTVEHSTLEVLEYKIIDLGPTKLSPRVLSRQCWPLTLSPRINNKGQVIGNRGDCGFFWDKCKGFYHFVKKNHTTCFVDITNAGILLGNVVNCHGFTKWFVWSESDSHFTSDVEPEYLNFPGLYDGDIFLRSMNDSYQVVGARRLEGSHYRSMYCDKNKQVKDLKAGVLLELNKYGNMVGNQTNVCAEQPFIWNPKAGLSVVSEDETSGKPIGIKKFGYPVIAEDNTVFGTYITKNKGKTLVKAYYWNPAEGIFNTMELGKMRISAVNRLHVLVGSQDNRAVVSVNHKKPVDLIEQVKGARSGWHLIEATDINDHGQIVGYGKYRGKLHIFLLNPIR